MEKVIEDVRAERKAQDEKWGQQNHSPEVWMLILGEEVGEACKAALDHKMGDILIRRNYREELIQVAAVAIAAVESFDRAEEKDLWETVNVVYGLSPGQCKVFVHIVRDEEIVYVQLDNGLYYVIIHNDDFQSASQNEVIKFINSSMGL